MKRIALLFCLLALATVGCRSGRDQTSYYPKDVPREWRTVKTDIKDSRYEISVEYITEKEYRKLSKQSYEYNYSMLDSTSEEYQRIRSMAIKGAPDDEIKSQLEGIDTTEGMEWSLIGIRKYPQVGQYELLFDQPYTMESVMMMGDKVDSIRLYGDLHSYSKDGFYACEEGKDSDFACTPEFYRFNPETQSMEYIGRYVDTRLALEEWGDTQEASLKWIAPRKLLCKGFKNPYENCWEWTPTGNTEKDYERNSNKPVYLIITLQKKQQ